MANEQKTAKTMNVILWIAQGLLALTFLWAGFMKLFQPEELPFPWAGDHADLVFITGIIDILAGIVIIVPALLRIQPKLTIYAAYGIVALMVTAIIFHVSRGEAKDIGFNIFMLLLAVFVGWGRQTK